MNSLSRKEIIKFKKYIKRRKEMQAPGEAGLMWRREGTACFTNANVCDGKLSTSALNRKLKIPSLDGLPKITQ